MEKGGRKDGRMKNQGCRGGTFVEGRVVRVGKFDGRTRQGGSGTVPHVKLDLLSTTKRTDDGLSSLCAAED